MHSRAPYTSAPFQKKIPRYHTDPVVLIIVVMWITVLSCTLTLTVIILLSYVYWDWKRTIRIQAEKAKVLERLRKSKLQERRALRAYQQQQRQIVLAKAAAATVSPTFSYEFLQKTPDELSPQEHLTLRRLWHGNLGGGNPGSDPARSELKSNSLLFLARPTGHADPVGTLVALILDTHDIWGKFSTVSNLNLNTDCLILYNICVHPEHRRRGLAKSLLQEVLTWAHQNSKRKVVLFVNVENGPAIRLYQGMGFEIDKSYFSENKDELMLSRTV